jgi:heme/copper-type cytochrome/quinol oxidase subunit 2
MGFLFVIVVLLKRVVVTIIVVVVVVLMGILFLFHERSNAPKREPKRSEMSDFVI